MGDQLMNFPTPLEVFGDSRNKPKSRKPPPNVINGTSPQVATQNLHQHRVNSVPVQLQPKFYPPPMHPQQQQRPQYSQQQQQQPQQFRPPLQMQQPTRHSSQPSLNSLHSAHSSPQYRAPVLSQQNVLHSPQLLQLPQQQFLPRSKKEVFDSIDADNSGSVSFQELANGLLNRDGSKFNIKASASIFKLFDSDDTQSLTYNEFSRLFDCLERWKTCFVMADKNSSSSLSFSEFQDALQVLGYRLSTDTALFVFQTFSELNLELRFDMFIESCVYLIRITRVFKKFDPQGNGVAVIQFENFVEEVLKIKTRI